MTLTEHVKTYYGHAHEIGTIKTKEADARNGKDEFDEPAAPVVVTNPGGDGLRVLLAGQEADECAADVLIERRPKGWTVFIHGVGGDPECFVYILDDIGADHQRVFFQKEYHSDVTILEPGDEVPDLDGTPAAKFNTKGTVTGRTQVEEPNAANLPRETARQRYYRSIRSVLNPQYTPQAPTQVEDLRAPPDFFAQAQAAAQAGFRGDQCETIEFPPALLAALGLESYDPAAEAKKVVDPLLASMREQLKKIDVSRFKPQDLSAIAQEARDLLTRFRLLYLHLSAAQARSEGASPSPGAKPVV